MLKEKRIWIVLLIVFLVALTAFLIISNEKEVEEITSFEECVQAGYPVMETYPRQCSVPEGELFVEVLQLEFTPEGEDYYGSSTYYPCEVDEDCITSGCNGETCKGLEEEGEFSICLYPDDPLAADMGYSCGCLEGQCQWK